ncbi:MAG: NADH:ubiquinone reductase (Na(+)-transporting) subunit F [Chitinophagales bacterium]|nr:NADH:ubiquinone reductase (Na(+)-transporting) subunit F [Chitinophagales bacterium]HAE14730.1 NADH:ubiquinone reductase (Na(+)-transporting) subunit F [Bacteroidota bacterium]MCB9019306.1 NADH:ubiquinone reductase (Na(+)-transporting) subunit F [Chitinophagales bacterium]MCB9020557.1 NADH:ubiquinone reductase (Na(+)-transporting) subunit F [Chitinophagales bacterium]MCB9031490.1 NADH:ubiquinone reductase (Na(+)-transporting) subunit F [Chitinophagales bacterium]
MNWTLLLDSSVIIYSIGVFAGVILLLTVTLLFAKSKLTPAGNVNIVINGENDKPVVTTPGGTLLSTLSQQHIYLPSACGGGGTCAMCKCQVIEGGGDILPTEEGYFTRKQVQDNWRLACQVKVREDMQIKVPEEVFGIKKWECEVVSNHNVATYIKEFVVKLPPGETLHFESGGYIQIDVPAIEVKFKDMVVEKEYHDEWDRYKMWDLVMKNDEPIYRAYSMANHPAEGNIVMLNIRIATPPWDRVKGQFMDVNPGICSSFIFSRKPGDKVMVSGPYGEFFIKPTNKEMVYIGGGAGMAPLRSHIFHLFHTMKTDRKVSYWYGGRSTRELFYTEQFQEIEKQFPNFSYHIALSDPTPEDNWTGPVGFIHQVVLDNYLKNHPEPEEIEYYLCGPPQMNAAVMKMLDNLGVPNENIAFDDFGG